MANKELNLEDQLREALASHEMAHSDSVWANIQTALPSTAAATVGGASILAKAAAVIGIAGLVAAASISEYRLHTSIEATETRDAPTELEQPISEQSTTPVQPLVEQPEEPNNLEVVVSNKTQKPVLKQEATKEISLSSNPISENSQRANTAGSPATISRQPEGSAQITNNNSAPKPNPTPRGNEAVAANQVQPSQANPKEPAEQKPEVQKTTAYFTHDAKQMISPNGDGIRDALVIDGHDINSFYLSIRSQGGQLIFESNDPDVQWQGVDRFGNNVPVGVYFFEIIATGTDGLPYLESNARGTVTVVR